MGTLWWAGQWSVAASGSSRLPDCTRAPFLASAVTISHPGSGSSSSGGLSKTVLVTRERGKNEKLMKALELHGISSLELPLIEHKEGPDRDKLPDFILDPSFDWFIITSPEAAKVFLEAWKFAGSPYVKLAVVGAGTAQMFEAAQGSSLRVEFVPSKANSKVLAEELPLAPLGGGKVLYPASLRASDELEKGLLVRGFEVVRLNTYSTESVKSVDSSALAVALLAPVVTFASPTAVWAWVNLVDISTWNGAAACIGQTSAIAAQNAGLRNIFYPHNPGIDGGSKHIKLVLKWVRQIELRNLCLQYGSRCVHQAGSNLL